MWASENTISMGTEAKNAVDLKIFPVSEIANYVIKATGELT